MAPGHYPPDSFPDHRCGYPGAGQTALLHPGQFTVSDSLTLTYIHNYCVGLSLSAHCTYVVVTAQWPRVWGYN